ncbi:hypothetical protein G6O69_33890 [Pseudenhygromyxa sp. WMMC2535]|uniref:hypothetical protein n=1 Tax=Pseudenhygromyxa sp. WMMC2535 TaxID=2712867 RepID=UPI00155180D2|nr:hypothetical protein [Pseudenhygromyxa sp. WMMC2535]NVB42862.1 hypothetical protein [Pseudenhygromyxa sp. WMMC2535]
MSSHARRAEDWLALGDNRDAWARLSEGLRLAGSFELLIAEVVGPEGAAQLSALAGAHARALGRALVELDAADEDVVSQLRALHGEAAALIVLDTVGASRRASEQLASCLRTLNPLRDQLAAELSSPVLMILRPDGLRRLSDLAPDLFSVHTARFRFVGGEHPTLEDRPRWLILDHECAGLLGIDPSFGPADRSREPTLAREPPQPGLLIGRELELDGLVTGLEPGLEQVMTLAGPPGVGRTALVAAAVERVRARWDRVVWLDCRLERSWADSDAIIDAVLRVLAPKETPPLAVEDARGRFEALTTREAVLIVADDLSSPGPTPGRRSCLLRITEALAAGERGQTLAPLAGADLDALVDAQGVPDEAKAWVCDASEGLPAGVRLWARWLRAGGSLELQRPPATPSLAEQCAALARGLGDEAWRVYDELQALSGWMDAFERGPVVGPGLAALVDHGVVVAEEELLRWAEDGIGGWTSVRRDTDWGRLAQVAEGPLADQLHNTLATLLQISSVHAMLLSWGVEASDVERCAASIAPARRAEVFRAATDALVSSREEEARLLTQGVEAALRCGQVERAHDLLDLSRRCGSIPSRLSMLVELRPKEWDSDAMAGLAGAFLGFEQDDPADDAMRLILGEEPMGRYGRPSMPTAPAARVALALRSDPCPADELLELALALDADTPLDRLAAHFVHARLAWIGLFEDDWSGFARSFAQVEASARAWGCPYALARLRLLELAAFEARGELDRFAASFEPALAAVDRCLGSRSREATGLLQHAAWVMTELDRSDEADALLGQVRARRRDI